LDKLCRGRRSLDDVWRARLTSAIQTLLTPQQIQAVAREAAEHLSFPSRNQIALRYEPGQSPVLAVRIQDVFGPSRHAFCTADRMICSWNQRGLDQLGILDLNQKTLTALELPFTDFAAVRAEGDRALAKKADAAERPEGVQPRRLAR
jgi:HrpA-like RNA helicase